MRWLIALVVFALSSCATNQSSGPLLDEEHAHGEQLSQAAHAAYAEGDMLVLYSYGGDAVGSEAFADWEAYFQTFVEGAALPVFTERVDAEFGKSLPGASIESDDFTVFIRCGFSTYYYSDLIVEPQVYAAVETAYLGEKLSAVDEAFLPEMLPYKQGIGFSGVCTYH